MMSNKITPFVDKAYCGKVWIVHRLNRQKNFILEYFKFYKTIFVCICHIAVKNISNVSKTL